MCSRFDPPDQRTSGKPRTMQGSRDDRPERREQPRPERSGNSGGDNGFDRNELFDIIASSPSAEQAFSAIARFVSQGEPDSLKQAIAVYVRSARARGASVERVLAELNAMTDLQHGRYRNSGRLLDPSDLKQLVLQTVLEGFVSENQ
jgi:hypothetical protein